MGGWMAMAAVDQRYGLKLNSIHTDIISNNQSPDRQLFFHLVSVRLAGKQSLGCTGAWE